MHVTNFPHRKLSSVHSAQTAHIWFGHVAIPSSHCSLKSVYSAQTGNIWFGQTDMLTFKSAQTLSSWFGHMKIIALLHCNALDHLPKLM